jgi:hypothetical protein
LGAFPPQWRGCAPAPSAASSGAERRSIDQSTRLRPTHSPPFVPSLLAGRLPASASSSASGRLGLVQVGPGPVIETPTRERHQRIPSRPVRSRRADPVREAVSARVADPSREKPPMPAFSNTQNGKFKRFQARNGKLKRRHQGPHSACIDRHARPWSFTL